MAEDVMIKQKDGDFSIRPVAHLMEKMKIGLREAKEIWDMTRSEWVLIQGGSDIDFEPYFDVKKPDATL